MRFKAKLRQIGNSQGIYIPKKVITSYKIGDILELEVITLKPQNVITSKNVITSAHKQKFNTQWCKRHKSMKGTCGCR